MKATIITIGDEILIGQIVDTNSASIARHLNAAGIVVAEKESVGDDRDAIVAALRRAMDGSDVTILTGGLGPTKDDITKRTLAELFGCELVRDERVARHVRRMLESRGIAYNDLNRGQSLVPACCTVLFNAHGTAPGMWFERDGRVVVSLPGVPFEMEHLMQDEVMPRLKARFALRQIVHRTLITSGLAESMLAERIAGWEAALPPYLHLAYLPSPDKVRLRLSAYEVEGEEVAHEIEAQFEKLRTIIPEYILGYETATIQSVVHDLLTQRHLTLATAESCTGGAIAARFTAMPGASAYFRCGVVSYTVEAKHDLLGVSLDDIDRYGVVSEPVVRAMAEGMRRTAHADYAVATTGVAGPAGGTPECPVGTVWMAVAGPQGTVAVCRQSGSDRGQIIDRASGQAIALLRDEILRQDTPRNEKTHARRSPKGPAAERSGGSLRRGRPSRRRILPHRLYDLRRAAGRSAVADARPDSPTHNRRSGRRLRHGSTIRRLDRRQRALPHLGGRSEKTTVTTRSRPDYGGKGGRIRCRAGLGPSQTPPAAGLSADSAPQIRQQSVLTPEFRRSQDDITEFLIPRFKLAKRRFSPRLCISLRKTNDPTG